VSIDLAQDATGVQGYQENFAMQTRRPFIPAAGHDLALPLYDPLLALTGAQSRRQLLIERAALVPGQRVLDIGCGTGTLAIAVKLAHPHVEVSGLDPDPLALARARSKAARAGVEVRFERGFGDALPFADASFARVFSSFMLHHLERSAQQHLLAEALRVLAPGGSCHIIDFARSERGAIFGRKLHGAEMLQEDLALAGFGEVNVERRPRWLFQRVVYGAGVRPVA